MSEQTTSSQAVEASEWAKEWRKLNANIQCLAADYQEWLLENGSPARLPAVVQMRMSARLVAQAATRHRRAIEDHQ